MNKSPNIHDYPRIVTYVNIRLSSLHFSLRKNIFFYKNILIVSFFINNNSLFLINIYSDSMQSVLKYLKDTEIDILNVLIIADDFNIRNSFWNPLYPHHSSYSDLLLDITDSFLLELLYPTNTVFTRFLDND